MKWILTLGGGYTSYQAQCLSPLVWLLVFGAIGYGLMEYLEANPKAAVKVNRWIERRLHVYHNDD